MNPSKKFIGTRISRLVKSSNDITHDFFPRIQNWSFSAAILNFGGHIEIQLLIYLFI